MTDSVAEILARTKSVVGSASIVVFLVMGVAIATAATQSPERDTAAISTLQSAISALGGANAVAAIQDCILTGSILNADGTSKTFNWTIAGNQFLVQTTTANGATNVFVSGHGSPAWITKGSTSALNSYMARANLPFYLPPYVLFQELSNPIYTLKFVGTVQLNGANVIQIHISDDSDLVGALVTPQEWYFDPVSFLPLRVQFREPSNENGANYVTAAYDLSQFGAVSGVMVPYKISFSDPLASEVVAVGTVTFNSGVPQNVFDAPTGGKQ